MTGGVVVNFGPLAGTGAGIVLQDMTELEFSKMTANPDRPPLDRWRFDALLEPERKLWGLPLIAEALGVSIDTARSWAKMDGVPIYRPAGTGSYFAFRTELLAWLRTKPANETR